MKMVTVTTMKHTQHMGDSF